MAIKAEPRDRTPPHPMNNPHYGDQQWRAEAGAYALSWASPPCEPEPRLLQVLSPDPNAGSPGLQATSPGLAHPSSPYMHQTMLSPHHAQLGMHQPSPGMHMQNLGIRSPHAPSVSPTLSPAMMHAVPTGLPPSVSPTMQQTMQQTMQPSMQQTMLPGLQASMLGLQSTMDPVMGDLGQQQPIYTQMDTTVHSTPSLATLLAHHGDEDVQFTSGDLSGLLLNERGDLSDSLNRLSTKDLLQP